MRVQKPTITVVKPKVAKTATSLLRPEDNFCTRKPRHIECDFQAFFSKNWLTGMWHDAAVNSEICNHAFMGTVIDNAAKDPCGAIISLLPSLSWLNAGADAWKRSRFSIIANNVPMDRWDTVNKQNIHTDGPLTAKDFIAALKEDTYWPRAYAQKYGAETFYKINLGFADFLRKAIPPTTNNFYIWRGINFNKDNDPDGKVEARFFSEMERTGYIPMHNKVISTTLTSINALGFAFFDSDVSRGLLIRVVVPIGSVGLMHLSDDAEGLSEDEVVVDNRCRLRLVDKPHIVRQWVYNHKEKSYKSYNVRAVNCELEC